MSLAGRRALVTGGAQGIGAAIAAALLDAGAEVTVWDIGGGTRVDVGDWGSVSTAAESLPPVDILVANAGILGQVAPLWQVDPADFARVIQVNLTGVFHTMRAVVPRMLAVPRAERHGRIVTMASIQGKEGTVFGGAYAASKAGVIALTKSLGKELATEGILVNAIAPTVVETAMAQEISADRRANLLARIPMGRFLAAEEVAAMALFLCSDACSFSTGAVFDLSGGRATY